MIELAGEDKEKEDKKKDDKNKDEDKEDSEKESAAKKAKKALTAKGGQFDSNGDGKADSTLFVLDDLNLEPLK